MALDGIIPKRYDHKSNAYMRLSSGHTRCLGEEMWRDMTAAAAVRSSEGPPLPVDSDIIP